MGEDEIRLILIHLYEKLTVKVVGIAQTLNKLQFHLESQLLLFLRLDGYCDE